MPDSTHSSTWLASKVFDYSTDALGSRALSVDHAGWPLLVLAFGKLPDPAAVIPGGVGNRRGGLAPRQQREDLPPAALMRLVGRSVPLLDVLEAQVRRQMHLSARAPIGCAPT